MAQLNDEQKIFIVQALACHDTPTQVIKSVKDEFGISISRQQVATYDCTKLSGKAVAKKWASIFMATRRELEADLAKIPVANRSYRMRKLMRYINDAESKGNIMLAAQLLEQAAKDAAGGYDNKRLHVHTGPDGKPIEVQTNHTKMTDAELDARIAELQAKTGVKNGDR